MRTVFYFFIEHSKMLMEGPLKEEVQNTEVKILKKEWEGLWNSEQR